MKSTKRILQVGETLVEKSDLEKKKTKEADLTVNLLTKAPE